MVSMGDKMKKATQGRRKKRAAAENSTRVVLRKLLFLGLTCAQAAKRAGVDVELAKRELDFLVENGIGVGVRGKMNDWVGSKAPHDRKKLRPYDLLSVRQAEIVAGVSGRRIRSLLQSGRVLRNEPAGQKMIFTDSLRDYVREQSESIAAT